MALMDNVERQRFLDTLRNDEEFRVAVRRELELEELRALPEQVTHLTNGVNGLIDDQAELRRSVATLVETQQRLHGDVGELTRIAGQTLRATSEGLGNVVERLGAVEGKVDQGFAGTSSHLDQLDAAIAELRNQPES